MERKKWVDNARVIACFLVVFGHLIQGLMKSDILVETQTYTSLINIIYYFHVPVFFFISGYLYQSSTKKTSRAKIILLKLIDLGVPYVVFTGITYVMKKVVSDSINSGIDHNLLYCIFVEPISPYWFLYILFFCFVFIPKAKTKKGCFTILFISLILKLYISFFTKTGFYLFDTLSYYLIFFVLGGVFAYYKLNGYLERKTSILSFLFIPVAIIYSTFQEIPIITFVLGLVGVWMTLYLSCIIPEIKIKMERYFIPIYVMHTICAACIRTILLKMGIHGALPHILIGLPVSILVPIVIGYIAYRSKYLNVFFSPTKTLQRIKNS